MKKNVIALLFILIIFGIVGWFFLLPDTDCTYCVGGRDTEVEFGNGRFAILIGYKPNEKGNLIKYFELYDRKINETIDYNIYNYIINKPYVYTVGYNGYTKLNYDTGEYEQSHDLSIFDQQDQDIFNKIENNKPLG